MSSDNSVNPGVQVGRVAKASSSFSGFTTVTSSLTSRSSSAYANLYDGPVPTVRETVQSTHTAFVELHRGKRPQGSQHIPPSVFIKNMLAMFMSVDKKAAILCYEKDKNFNSICHPMHVPASKEEFERYFPRVYNTRGTVTIKCRVTSSISLVDIKRLIMDKLRKHNYYVRPTILKAVRTSKAGWMYLAHPDLTLRKEFTTTLAPLIQSRFNRHIEFQVAPETENLDTDQGRISQRVLVVRSAYEETDTIRSFFTEAFSPESTMGIGFLARYTFVPGIPVGNCTKNHLVTLLKMQQQFHKNVFWYMWTGMRNIDTEVSLLPETTDLQKSQPSATPQTQEDVDMEEVEAKSGPSNDVVEAISQPEKASLKRILYELVNDEGENLIHAVYPSMDASKLYVLCSEKNKDTTLEHLHKIQSVLDQVFEPGATEVFFNPEGRPYVHNFPVLTDHQNAFVDSIVGLTKSANPQEEATSPEPHVSFAAAVISQSPPKRLRNGDSKPNSNLPNSILRHNERHDSKTHDSLNETLARLKHIESNELSTKESFTDVSHRLDQQAQDISTLGKALESTNEKVEKVCVTQVQQGKTMENMDGSLQAILSQMKSLNKFNQKFMSMAEPSQGGEVSRS